MKIGFQFPGTDGSTLGYGKFQNIPDFGAPYCAVMLGSLMTATPGTNLFAGLSGAAGNATVLGAPSTNGLSLGGAVITASIASGVLNVSTFSSGTPLAVGNEIYFGGVYYGTISSLGTGTGGTGTYNMSGSTNVSSSTLVSCAANVKFPGTPRTLFNTTSAVTLFGVAKVAAAQEILGDYTGNNPSMSLLAPTGSAGGSQAYGNDGAANANSTTNGPDNNNATTWSFFAGIFTSTTAQAFHQRTATGRYASTAATKASGAIGSTTNVLQSGRPYGNVAPSGNVAVLGAYTKALSLTANGEMDQLFAACVGLMTDIGETL